MTAHVELATLATTVAPSAGIRICGVRVGKALTPFVPLVPLDPAAPVGPGTSTVATPEQGLQQSATLGMIPAIVQSFIRSYARPGQTRFPLRVLQADASLSQ